MSDNLAQLLLSTLLRRSALAAELIAMPPRLLGTPLEERVVGADPVIIVHGIVDSENGSYDYANSLRRDGFQVFTPTMPNGGLDGVMANVAYLKQYVAWVLRTTGATRVDFVGHSQGGLTIRAFIKSGGEDLVESVVTINSPHHGVAGYWRPLLDAAKAIRLLGRAIPAGLMELDSRSELMRWLNEGDETPGDIRYTALLSGDADGIVTPWTSPILDGARHIVLEAGRLLARGPHHVLVNHTDETAFETVRAALREPRTQARRSAALLASR